jgi:hypothetical protein
MARSDAPSIDRPQPLMRICPAQGVMSASSAVARRSSPRSPPTTSSTGPTRRDRGGSCSGGLEHLDDARRGSARITSVLRGTLAGDERSLT